MDEPLARQQIADLTVAPPALAERFAAEALRPGRAAVEVLRRAPDASGNARRVLGDGGELSIAPLLDAQALGAADRAWAITVAVRRMNQLRRDTVRWLEPLLADRTPAPAQPGVEKKRRPRVCDMAYLALVRVVTFGTSEVDPHLEDAKFLALPERRRDAFISGIQLTATYRRAR